MITIRSENDADGNKRRQEVRNYRHVTINVTPYEYRRLATVLDWNLDKEDAQRVYDERGDPRWICSCSAELGTDDLCPIHG